MKKTMLAFAVLTLAGCANLPQPGKTGTVTQSAPVVKREANATILHIAMPQPVLAKTKQTTAIGGLLDSLAVAGTNALFAGDATVTVKTDKGITKAVKVPSRDAARMAANQRVALEEFGGSDALFFEGITEPLKSARVEPKKEKAASVKSEVLPKSNGPKQSKATPEKVAKAPSCRPFVKNGKNYQLCYADKPMPNALKVVDCSLKPAECSVKSGYKSILNG